MSLNSNSPEDEEVQSTKFSTFLKRVFVTLNGKSVDEWDTTATELDDTMNFYRMHSIMGFCKSRGYYGGFVVSVRASSPFLICCPIDV